MTLTVSIELGNVVHDATVRVRGEITTQPRRSVLLENRVKYIATAHVYVAARTPVIYGSGLGSTIEEAIHRAVQSLAEGLPRK